MELVRASDLVLTMTESQRAVVGRMAEAGYSKTFTLREFVRLMGRSNVAGLPLRAAAWQAHLARPMIVAPSQPEDVVDPVGGSARLLRRVTHDLGELTEEIARALFP
jgi:protein-tyrosine-phosphatase